MHSGSHRSRQILASHLLHAAWALNARGPTLSDVTHTHRSIHRWSPPRVSMICRWCSSFHSSAKWIYQWGEHIGTADVQCAMTCSRHQCNISARALGVLQCIRPHTAAPIHTFQTLPQPPNTINRASPCAAPPPPSTTPGTRRGGAWRCRQSMACAPPFPAPRSAGSRGVGSGCSSVCGCR